MSMLPERPAGPWALVQRLNAAWRSQQLDTLAALFHERAVIVDGVHQRVAVGRAACIESYRAFVASATVEDYREGPPSVDEFEDCAVVTYPFEICYTAQGKTYNEAGTDCLLLECSTAEWVVVWRQLVWRPA
jgi:hypothetical protein